MNKIILFCLFITLLISGCDGNYQNVQISGIVSDEHSGTPIAGVNVTVISWVYDTSIWESRKIIKNDTTDAAGKYVIDFQKSEAMDIKFRSPYYMTFTKSLTLKKRMNVVNVKLERVD